MCDRIDENQDPLQKISWQLSELLSAQQSGQLAPEFESSHWTQFSGIPSEAGPTTFPNLYPWNPLSVSSRSSTDAVGNEHHYPVHQPNDCLGDSTNPLQNGLSHTPWVRDNASFPHQTFHGSDEFGGGYFDIRSPYAYAHNHQLESHRSGCVENSLLPQQGSTNSQRGFGIDGNSVTDPSNLYASSEYVALDQTSHALNVSPSSHFAHVSRSVPKSPSAVGQSSDHLKESLKLAGLQASPPIDSSGSSFTFPNRNFALGSRSLSHDPSLDLTTYLSAEKKSSVGLDLGFSLEKRSSVPEAAISSAVEGRAIYAEALSKLHSFDSANISPTLGSDFPSSSQTSSEPSSPDLSKPSYSDIAKTPKSSQSSVLKPDQPICDNFQKNQSSRVSRKDIKASRPFVRRTTSNSKFWPRGSLGEDAEVLKMPTNSRYGLDSFDDKLVNSGSPLNCSDLRSSKKESESPLHSSISSLDDILPGMSSQRVMSGGGDASSLIGHEKRTEKVSLRGSGSPSIAKAAPTQKFDNREEEPLFFDPRRIFQTKSLNKSKTQSSSSSISSNRQVGSKTCEQEHTVLNNGKPTACSASKLPTTARKHDYINNDLRDSSKLTNQTAAEVSSPTNSNHDTLHQHRESKSGSGRRFRGRSSSSSHGERKKSPEKRAQGDNGANYEYNAPRGLVWSHVDLEKLEEWCSKAVEKLTACLGWLVNILVNLLLYTLGLIIYLSSSAVHLLFTCIGKCWTLVKERVFGYGEGNETNWSSRDFLKRKVGLEENIALPSTGDEAMKRLLSCKGKDPYSILGVRADSSDDDIKKHYRKQAILVHPDKNTEPGAEEAFKILGHAIEMIGDPVKRKQYDSHTQEEFDADAMRAFAEMLSKLQAKIQEAANIMPCDNCGGKHRRFPVDRPFYSARFCARCNLRHPAKEGDVWAESTMLGFLWHYYALMEGRVYEITEWMRCHQEIFKHMKANDHSVVTRIANGGGNRKPHYRSTSEPNMEEFINRLFKANERNASRHTPGGHPQHPGAEPGWGHAGPGPAGSAPSAGGGKKSGRRNRKKRT